MVENPYFQFPLGALAFGKTEYQRLNTILDYSVVEAGSRLFRKLTREQQTEFFDEQCERHKVPQYLDENVWLHRAALYGAHVIGVTYTRFDSVMERYATMSKHMNGFVSRYGSDALVRIKKNWLFDARDGRGFTYREFAVLCGIYSAIGNKELAIITRERIRHCAMGYRTGTIMQAEVARRSDKAQPLTERQLRDTIERLHRNKFFARCTVARRITYYSIRLNNEDFRKKVLERRTYPDYFRGIQAAQDLALTDSIKLKRREAAKAAPQTPPTTRPFRFPPLGDPR